MAAKVLLCDLDGTLVDRDAGFALWAEGFAAARGLDDEQRRWLAAADRLHRQRGPFFHAVVDHLALREEPEALWAEYRQQMPRLAPVMDGVLQALAAMRREGWLIAVVSNGRSDNQRGKVEASGLAPLLHAVVVSEEAGIRKPDPAIFSLAVDACAAERPGAVWLIGDDPSDDIAGGAAAGLATVWVSGGRDWPASDCKPTATIRTTAEGLDFIRRNAAQ